MNNNSRLERLVRGVSLLACVLAFSGIGRVAEGADAAAAAAAGAQAELRGVEKGVEPAPAGTDEGGWFSRMFRKKSRASDTNGTVTVTMPEADKTGKTEAAPKPAAPAADANAVNQLNIAGDAAALIDKAGLKADLEEKIVGKSLTSADLATIAKEAQDALRKKGYILATVTAAAGSPAKGVAELSVKSPLFGKMSFSQLADKEGAQTREPFAGKYFSEQSLKNNLRDVKEGDYFCYSLLVKDLLQINTKPDVKLDTKLVSRTEEGRQYADMNFTVRESLPLHAIIEANNTGSEETDIWRLGATVQHLNLTKHDDVLTLRVLGSPDFSKMWSVAGSYGLPCPIGSGGQISLYGGYASVDSDEMDGGISIEGDNFFAGLQAMHRLVDSADHQFSVGLGAVYRDLNDTVVMSGSPLPERKATVVPFSLILSYASARPDGLGGRTFISSETLYNLGDAFGVTKEDEIDDQRTDAKANYLIERLQLARLQPLFGRVDDKGLRRGQWTLFAKAQGQVANGAVIAAEGIGIGGMNTVRGYEERTLLGDHGLSGTIEMRTPMFAQVIGRLFGSQAAVFDRTQFLVFADGGSIYRSDALAAEIVSDSIFSAGLGLRMSFRESAQVRVDAGYRLCETRNEDNGVGWHFAAQWQF